MYVSVSRNSQAASVFVFVCVCVGSSLGMRANWTCESICERNAMHIDRVRPGPRTVRDIH